MPFIRLSDDYNDHPKFDCLCDGAFRLWHQGMGFCRKYQTDGLIPMATVRKFKAYSPKRMKELLTPWQPGANALWQTVEGFGVKVHDYLFWNLSKEEEQEARTAATERMRRSRAALKAARAGVRDASHLSERSLDVQERAGSDLRQDEKRTSVRAIAPSDDIASRAGKLLQAYQLTWYPKYRHGARLRLVGNSLEFEDACRLCETWDDARLEQLAGVVLTTDDDYISKTDRSFKIFALKASWADDKLRQWELTNGVSA